MGDRHPTRETQQVTDIDPNPTVTDPPADLPTDPPADPPAPDTGDEVAKWKAMARKHEAAAKANAEAATRLAEIEAANKTQAEKDAEAKTAAEQRAVAAETALARMKVAAAKGLPSELADRLQGANEQEMAEDADRLLAVMQPATPPPPGGTDAGPQGDKPNAPSIQEQIATAEAAGDFTKAIGLKSRLLAQQAAGS